MSLPSRRHDVISSWLNACPGQVEVPVGSNFFVSYQGAVHYYDHEEPKDDVWGKDLDEFFERALVESRSER